MDSASAQHGSLRGEGADFLVGLFAIPQLFHHMTKTTLMAILGRMATYTGQKITSDQAMNSQENLSPERYDWDVQPPKSEVAVPGVTKFI